MDLFIQVCQAVQHAHQKGIIHRDLKPSNILVTELDGAPLPKVIDFGIAKAVEGRLTDQTLFTAFEQFIGTPAYMSPEQASMNAVDVDTRSDIYSLGVLLYELLTGRPPLEQRELLEAGFDAMRRTLREKEPPRPSTRLSQLAAYDLTAIAKARQSEPPKLIHLMRGDLDWIVMKCLEKDRGRRYETAGALAMDLTRHLGNEPVVAHPPSKLYEFQKTVRRHKFGFTAGAAVISVLAVGAVVSTLEAIRARHAEQEQAHLREEAQQAEAHEAQLRHQAEAQELAARRTAYASDMNLAQQAVTANRLGRAQQLLNRQRPQPGQKDLRGWEWRYLWQYCNTRALFTLPQAANPIWTLSASRDGKWLAVGEYDNGGLSVWDLGNRREKVRLPAGDGKVHTAFSPTAPLLAYSTVAGPPENPRANIKLWDVSVERGLGELPLGAACAGLAFTADGLILVTSTATPDNQITLWRVSDRTKLAGYAAPQNAVEEAIPFAITSDASFAAYGSPTIHLLDLATGQELWKESIVSNHVMALVFSPDGKILASSGGYTESAIRLWEAASGKQLARSEAHGGWVSAMGFWPDGKALASASADGTVRIWNLSQLTNIPAPRVVGIGTHEEWRPTLLPDDTRLVSGALDGSIRVWGTPEQVPPDSPITLPVRLGGAWRFAPDSQSLVTVSGGRVAEWIGRDFQEKRPLMVAGGSGDSRDYLFSKDGELLAVTSDDGNARVWDLPQRRIKYEFKCPGYSSPVAFLSGNSKLVVTDRAGGALHEWSLTAGLETRSWTKPEAGTHWSGGVDFSRDDRWLLSVDSAGTSSLYDLIANRPTRADLGIRHVEEVAFSADSAFFAALSLDPGQVKLWETESLRPLGTMEADGHAMAFSPDGERLALGGVGKKAVKIWDLAGAHELLSLEGESPLVWRCEFSPDGNVLGALNGGGVLLLWRAPSWAEIEAAEKVP